MNAVSKSNSHPTCLPFPALPWLQAAAEARPAHEVEPMTGAEVAAIKAQEHALQA